MRCERYPTSGEWAKYTSNCQSLAESNHLALARDDPVLETALRACVAVLESDRLVELRLNVGAGGARRPGRRVRIGAPQRDQLLFDEEGRKAMDGLRVGRVAGGGGRRGRVGVDAEEQRVVLEVAVGDLAEGQEERLRREAVAVAVEGGEQPLSAAAARLPDADHEKVAGGHPGAAQGVEHLLRDVVAGVGVEALAADEDEGVLVALTVEDLGREGAVARLQVGVPFGVLHKDRGRLLDEDYVAVAVGAGDDIAHPRDLADDERVAQRRASRFPRAAADRVQDVDEYGVENSQTQDLERHTDRLLLLGDGRVLAPQNGGN